MVRVRDCFEANSTAYIVNEDGEPLDRLLQRLGTLTEAQLKRVVLPVADGLRHVHAAGFLHRDVKPSNIYVRRSDESPVLLDFGSARLALGRKSRSMTAIASAGYSPPERTRAKATKAHRRTSTRCPRSATGRSRAGCWSRHHGGPGSWPARGRPSDELGGRGRCGMFVGLSGCRGLRFAADRDGAPAECAFAAPRRRARRGPHPLAPRLPRLGLRTARASACGVALSEGNADRNDSPAAVLLAVMHNGPRSVARKLPLLQRGGPRMLSLVAHRYGGVCHGP